jgi:hypothetical protein
MNRCVHVLAGALCAAGLLVSVAGCFQRSTYPAIPTSRGFNENPNTPAGEQAIVAAVQYVASRWTPGEREYDPTSTPRGLPMVQYPMVVNLPLGMRKLYYDRIPTKIGPDVLPATPESVVSGKPVFHVARVWLRFNSGIVDILRPMPEVGLAPDGQPVYQKITVRLEGGMKPWTVVHARSWVPGDDTAPDFYFVPAIDDPNQFAITMREHAATLTHEQAPANSNTIRDLVPQQQGTPAIGSPTPEQNPMHEPARETSPAGSGAVLEEPAVPSNDPSADAPTDFVGPGTAKDDSR